MQMASLRYLSQYSFPFPATGDGTLNYFAHRFYLIHKKTKKKAAYYHEAVILK